MHSDHEFQSKPAEKPVADIQQVGKPDPGSEPESKPEPDPESEPESKPEPDPGSELESKLEAKREIGGRKGLDPTRYGDWEKNGRCIDF